MSQSNRDASLQSRLTDVGAVRDEGSPSGELRSADLTRARGRAALRSDVLTDLLAIPPKRAARGIGCSMIAAVAASIIGPGALAEGRIPTPQLVFQIAGFPIDIDPWSCGETVPLADGTFLFTGRYDVEGLGGVRWSMRVDPDPYLSLQVVFTNNTETAQDYWLFAYLECSAVGPTCVGGSIVGSVSDGGGDGAAVAALPGEWIYSAQIDSQPVPEGMLLPASTSFVAGPFATSTIGPASFGQPIPALPFDGVDESLTIYVRCSLTSNDAATISCNLQVEPECVPPADDLTNAKETRP